MVAVVSGNSHGGRLPCNAMFVSLLVQCASSGEWAMTEDIDAVAFRLLVVLAFKWQPDVSHCRSRTDYYDNDYVASVIRGRNGEREMKSRLALVESRRISEKDRALDETSARLMALIYSSEQPPCLFSQNTWTRVEIDSTRTTWPSWRQTHALLRLLSNYREKKV